MNTQNLYTSSFAGALIITQRVSLYTNILHLIVIIQYNFFSSSLLVTGFVYVLNGMKLVGDAPPDIFYILTFQYNDRHRLCENGQEIEK